jgi:asparagine synthase (glutamine-hydrolysing)
MENIGGLSGIIGQWPDRSRQVRIMVNLLHREPADACHQFSIDEHRLSFAWTAKDDTVQEPVWNNERDLCAILVGRIVGDIPDNSQCNHHARQVVQLYERFGSDCFRRLNGLFCGLIIDLREQKSVLFNDRYGLNRMYYHTSANGFSFSSEAKSLLAILPQARRIDEQGLAEFLSLGCVLQDRTIFTGISLLPAGSQWTFYRSGRVERRRYFNPESWEQQESLDAHTYVQRLTEVFARVAPRYIWTAERAALSLTGGLDSRMILAWANPPPHSLPCYTFGGPYRDCADVRIARKLAEICRQPHTTISIEHDFFADFPSLAERAVYLSDGTMDVSGAVELYVNQQARAIAPVRITGNYGSEILRSNVAFGPRPFDRSMFTNEFAERLEGATETYRSEATGKRLSFIAFKQVPWHHYARLSLERSELRPRSPFLDNELVQLAYQAPRELADSPAPILALVAAGKPSLGKIATDRALRSNSLPLLGRLSKAWQEFTAKAEYAYDYGMPQWFVAIDSALKPLRLERLFLGRHKFYHYRVWYRDRLREYLMQMSEAESDISRMIFRPGYAKMIVAAHVGGLRNYTDYIHKLLTFALLERRLTRC